MSKPRIHTCWCHYGMPLSTPEKKETKKKRLEEAGRNTTKQVFGDNKPPKTCKGCDRRCRTKKEGCGSFQL